MTTRNRLRDPRVRALVGLGAVVAAVVACAPGPPSPAVSTTASASPPSSPSLPSSTAAPPVGVAAIPGTWTAVGVAAGLCTDSPRLVGAGYVADGTTLCAAAGSPTDPASLPTAWNTLLVPAGTEAAAAVRFPPGGGLVVATDDGPCVYETGGATASWRCATAATGYPYTDIHDMTNLGIDAVYALSVAVVLAPDVTTGTGTSWDVPTAVAAPDAVPTRLTALDTPGEEIWVGTNGYGLVVVDVATGTTSVHTASAGLPHDDVRDVVAGATDPTEGRGAPVWVATAGGVGRWDGTGWTSFTTSDGLPANDVQALDVDAAGRVWVATAAGAASFDGTGWHAYTAADGAPGTDLLDVAATAWGVWFATAQDGLVVFLPG